ncbi:hypothetical protein [Bradyrhizobium genosp. P]
MRITEVSRWVRGIARRINRAMEAGIRFALSRSMIQPSMRDETS